jgi:hypothetical protein
MYVPRIGRCPIPEDMDAARTHALTQAVSRLLQGHLSAPPHGPFKVFEALNALAVATDTLSCGTDDIVQCMDFFKEAVEDQVSLIETAKAKGTFPKGGTRQ